MSKKFFIILTILIASVLIFFCYILKKGFIKYDNTISTTVEFTKTYSVDAILNYTDSTGKYGYIIVNQFQMDMPTVMKIEYELLGNIEIGGNYEFTFRGNKLNNKDYDVIYEIINNFKLVKLEKTDKKGMEQIQDIV